MGALILYAQMACNGNHGPLDGRVVKATGTAGHLIAQGARLSQPNVPDRKYKL